MADDESWLDHSNQEEEKEEIAYLYLMGKEVKYDDSEDETADEVKNKLLNKKVNGLEAKLYARSQTDQTIFLNAHNEEADVKEKWGLGFQNPHYLKKAIRKQPALYNFDFLACAETPKVLSNDYFASYSISEMKAKPSIAKSANDFLNSDGGCIEEIDMFDFNASLPDHSTCLINEKVLPSGFNIGESSAKIGESVSVTADYYA
ncbi:hypothetical protein L6452_22238 [Arctium lappa]|uniref:Uncharacterized protein n=1 Tax=Arctium lappa TaxID=4217 RepID=A0ACB9AYV1_ARCLA|nr:hypothetical protein L6452_22238 [Arctium lappa]